MNYVFLHGLNLAEIILSLNALYSYAVDNEIKIKIASTHDVALRELLITFYYFPYLEYGKMKIKTAKSLKNKIKFSDLIDLDYFENYHRKDIGFTDIDFTNKIKDIVLPFNKLKFHGKTYSSCFELNNKNMSMNKMKQIVSKFGKIDSICVGGIRTKNYFEHRLNHFDNIRRISHTMLSCDYYFGIDEGMAGLSGTIGIPAKIIFQEKKNKCMLAKKEMYDFFYLNFSFFDSNFEKITDIQSS